jgi:hypothetical protein
MTPLTKEVAAALARDDPNLSPVAPSWSSTCRHPPRRSPSPYPWSYELVACWAPLPRALTKPFVRMLESAMEVIWDLLIFFALVAVGLVVLNLLAHRR